MEDERKTKKQLIEELNSVRKSVAELECFAEELKQSKINQEKFTKAFLQNSIPAVITTLKEGRIVEVSNAFLRLVGLKRGEVVGHTSREIGYISEEQRKAFVGELNKSGCIENLEMEIKAKNGELRYGLFNSVMMNFNHEKYFLTAIQDITERKRVEEALQASEIKYRNLYQSMVDAFVSVDMNGNIIDCNDFYLDMLGYTPEEISKLNFKDITPEKWHAIEDAIVEKQVLTKKYSDIYEKEYRRKDGTVFPVELRTTLIMDNKGNPISMWAIVRDITERKRVEAVLRVNEERFRTLYENVPVFIDGFDSNGRCILWNRECEKVFGWTVDEINAHEDPLALFYPDPDVRRDVMDTVTSKPEKIFREWHPLTKEGKELTTLWANFQIPGGIVINIGYDITESNKAEEKLRESERKYRSLVENASDIIFRTDKAGYFTFVNLAAIRITGYKEEDLIGRQYTILLPPEKREEALLFFGHQLMQGIPNTYSEYPVLTKNGQEFWVGQNVQLVVEGDTVSGFQIVAHDITERKSAQDALREVSASLKLACAAGSVGLWDWHLQTNKVFYSPEWKQQIGYEDHEISNDFSEWQKRVHPDDLESALRSIRAFIEKPWPNYQNEFRFHHKDGSYRWILAQASLLFDDKSTPVRMMGCHIDITNRKQAEDELRKSEEKFRKAFYTSPDSVNINRLEDGMYISINSGFTRIMGYTEEDSAGKTSIELNIWENTEDRQKLVAGLKKDGEVKNLEAVFRAKSGDIRYGLMSASVIDLNGVPHIISITRDITERKKLEQSMEESEQKFSAAFKTNPIPTAISTIQDGLFLDVNEAFIEIFSFSSKTEIIGKTSLELGLFANPTDRQSVRKDMEERGRVHHRELKMVTKDRRTLDMLFSAEQILIGNKQFLLTSAMDITDRVKAAEALNASEEKYRTLIDKLQEGVIIAQGGVFALVNRRMSEMLGVPLEDLKGKPFIDFVWPEDQEMVMRNYRMRISGETIDDGYDFRIIGAQGKLTWVFISASLIMWDGQPATLNIVKDITERKRVEETQEFLLQCGLPSSGEDFFESLARYLAQTTGMDYVCIDRLEGDGLSAQTVAVYNEGMFECNVSYALKDTPCGEVVGKGVCCYPRDVRHLFPRDQALQELKAESYYGTTLIDSKGQQIGLIAIIGHHVLDDTNLIESLLKMVAPRATGELERRKAEEELARRESLLNKIFDVLPIGLWFADENGKLLRGNPAGVKIWGAEPTVPMEEYGVFVARRLPSGEEIAPDDWALAHTIKEGIAVHDELLEIDAFDGQKRVVLNYTAPVLDDKGHLLGAIVVNNDITDRIQSEQEREKLQTQLIQAQKMESVGRLAGGVAHDFNNMLGVILGHIEMALEHVDPAQSLYEDLQEIQKAANRSADLTRQLLAFARKQTIAPRVLDLNDTIEGMLKMLQRLIGEDIKLSWVPQAGLWPIKMDPSQIDQILANLCVNARDAISGVGKITIETADITLEEDYCAEHGSFVPGDYVLLAVSDDGCGMDTETKIRLFEPFFTTKSMEKGTGLGLSTVYGIVKQNHGFIYVYSEPGEGTTFRIYLPRHVGKAEQIQKKGFARTEAIGHETILLAEDEPTILHMTKRMLEKMGYPVLAAATPGEAIRLAEQHAGEIHLLITDVVMPEMNGRDLARKLLSLYPDIRRLFMSGYTANVIAHHGVLDEGVHFIQKPFSMKDLGAKVRETLDGN